MRLPTHKYLSLDVIIISLAKVFRKWQFVRIHTIMPRGYSKTLREQSHPVPLPDQLPRSFAHYLTKGYTYDGRHLIGPVRKDGTRGIILWPVKNLT